MEDTERDELLEKIKVQETALKKQEKLISELEKETRKYKKMFSVLAHDLRSPFNSILNFSELLVEALEADETKKEIASVLYKSATGYFHFLEEFLELSRLWNGSTTLNRITVSTFSLLDSSIGIYLTKIKEKNITVTYPKGNVLDLHVDSYMIGSVIRNFLSNAIKFTPPNGNIIINYAISDNNITFSVKDNGIGMSKELLGKLFIEGEEVRQRDTEKNKGSGLGLLLCKEFVELHDGMIWAESKQGEGTTMFFCLPLLKSADI